ncbi:MAG TPA: phosphotransferase [Caldilineaceae bacterium]|nr:phosphotransferase [Caldilineaceae bacterium]
MAPDRQIPWADFPFNATQLMDYLATRYQGAIELHTVRKMKEAAGDELKAFGYGNPLYIEFSHFQRDGASQRERVVLHTMAPERFGHERRADRAYNMLLEFDTFNKLPRHAPSADVGAIDHNGDFISLGTSGEFFHLSTYVPGTLYADDLMALLERGTLTAQDEKRAVFLADYLAQIHVQTQPNPRLTNQLYCRTWRDLVGHGEGIMGMLDSYPADFAVAPPARLEAIERRCSAWRWRLKGRSHRLRQTHGDFHPWNVLFAEDDNFALLDRSRGEWGDPADDVSAMAINYLFFSLQQHGAFTGPFAELFHQFWERYLSKRNDQELEEVVSPFFVWRALVVAHPVWYPHLDTAVRSALFRFIEAVLAVERFEPKLVQAYLQ